MPLFEVAILELPTKNEREDGKGERLVMAPKAVVAKDGQTAAVAASLELPKDAVDFSRAEIIVRPFA